MSQLVPNHLYCYYDYEYEGECDTMYNNQEYWNPKYIAPDYQVRPCCNNNHNNNNDNSGLILCKELGRLFGRREPQDTLLEFEIRALSPRRCSPVGGLFLCKRPCQGCSGVYFNTRGGEFRGAKPRSRASESKFRAWGCVGGWAQRRKWANFSPGTG